MSYSLRKGTPPAMDRIESECKKQFFFSLRNGENKIDITSITLRLKKNEAIGANLIQGTNRCKSCLNFE